MEITLKDLWRVLKKSVLFVILGAIVLGAVFYVYTATTEQKVYQSSAKYYLQPLNPALTAADMNNNLVVGAKYIPTLGDYLMTKDTMELVLKFAVEWPENPEAIPALPAVPEGEDPATWPEKWQARWKEYWTLEGEYTASSLLSRFTFVSPGEDSDTLIFRMRCRATSPKDSRILLHAMGNVINERAKTAVLNDSYEVETVAEPANGAQIAPNPMNKALLGVAIGAVLPYLVFFVLALIDTRIKTEEDVKSRFEYPILGQIPRL